MHSGINDRSFAFAVAVIDGPYDAAALSKVLASTPVSLANGSCDFSPNSACDHGTFIVGLLGARQDALIPGLCPDCQFVHVPLFADAISPSASVDELATAIAKAVSTGARLINLSLAILCDESEINHRLAAALDFAETSGSVLVVAAGNHGHLAIGQLLAHPVVIPVVAADASQRLLPESNFGPTISGRGVAALGRMPGYTPGGGITVMSGTSVAAGVATGILAQVWSARPDIDGATLRSVIAGLGPRNGSMPPMLNRELVLAALDQRAPTALEATGAVEMRSHVSLQGATTMANGNGQPILPRGSALIARPAQTVTPAGGGCECGAPSGACSCQGGEAGVIGFVYAIGTIEAEYPSEDIEWEMQRLAVQFDVPTKPTDDRDWQHAVLSSNRKTRYIARQLRWRLTIEGFPVFVLSPSDPSYFDDLVDALAPPKDAETKSARRGGKRAAASKAPEVDPAPSNADDLNVVVGVMGPQTPDGITVFVDQIFDLDPACLTPDGLTYFSQLADNRGLTDEDRAYNYLVARCRPPLDQGKGFSLSGVRVVPSRLGPGAGASRIVRAIYTFKNAERIEKTASAIRSAMYMNCRPIRSVR